MPAITNIPNNSHKTAAPDASLIFIFKIKGGREIPPPMLFTSTVIIAKTKKARKFLGFFDIKNFISTNLGEI
jgi:hypothetical protein